MFLKIPLTLASIKAQLGGERESEGGGGKKL